MRRALLEKKKIDGECQRREGNDDNEERKTKVTVKKRKQKTIREVPVNKRKRRKKKQKEMKESYSSEIIMQGGLDFSKSEKGCFVEDV